MFTPDDTDILDALSAIATSLRSDGYDLAVSVNESRILVSITAGPQACAECLVSKDLMSNIISTELRFRGLPIENRALVLAYPADSPAHE